MIDIMGVINSISWTGNMVHQNTVDYYWSWGSQVHDNLLSEKSFMFLNGWKFW